MPVAHKQGADRSGSEDLDENFCVAGKQVLMDNCSLAYRFILLPGLVLVVLLFLSCFQFSVQTHHPHDKPEQRLDAIC